MHVASCSSASYKHVFVSWECPLSQFPPLASHLQDVEEPRPKGRVCAEVAGCGSHRTAVTHTHTQPVQDTPHSSTSVRILCCHGEQTQPLAKDKNAV